MCFPFADKIQVLQSEKRVSVRHCHELLGTEKNSCRLQIENGAPFGINHVF